MGWRGEHEQLERIYGKPDTAWSENVLRIIGTGDKNKDMQAQLRQMLLKSIKDSIYYTEEQGVNLFTGRNALFLQLGRRGHPPRSIRGGFGRTELISTIEVRTGGRVLRELRVYACYDYRTMPL